MTDDFMHNSDGYDMQIDNTPPSDDGYITITPELLAVSSLLECANLLHRSSHDPTCVAHAGKAAHLAVQAALTAAVAGPMSIGAYDQKLEERWLAYLSGQSNDQPTTYRVMPFDALLEKARATAAVWNGRPFIVEEEQVRELERLTFIRHNIEHVKPGFWIIEKAFITKVLPTAADLSVKALRTVEWHLEPSQMMAAESAAAAITDFCSTL